MIDFINYLFNKEDIRKKEKIKKQFDSYVQALNNLKQMESFDKIFGEYVDLKKYAIIEQIWTKAKNDDDEGYDKLIKKLKQIAVLEKLTDELEQIEQNLTVEEEQIKAWKRIENNFNK